MSSLALHPDIPVRYGRNIAPLTGGGMSDTFVCDDSALGRKVVIKFVKPGMDPRRILDELAALSALRSKYVVQVFDVIRRNGAIVGFVEEYIDGTPLQPWSIGDDPSTLIGALYSLAAGLADIHGQGQLHRDIKPDNMKYDSIGTLKIFDFGLAKSESNVGTRNLFFTPGFTPPEALQFQPNGVFTYTKSVDIFAFGAVAVWLLNNGVMPASLTNLPPSIPCNIVQDIIDKSILSAEIKQSIKLCLSINPNDRPEAKNLKSIMSRHMLRDRHKMQISIGGGNFTLHSGSRRVRFTSKNQYVDVVYDGFDFSVAGISGAPRLNNATMSVGDVLTGASVIVFRHEDNIPVSAAVNVSHPEVML